MPTPDKSLVPDDPLFANWSQIELTWIGDGRRRTCPYFGKHEDTSEHLCDNSCNIWVAHTHPERPLDTGMWIDDCQICVIKLRAAAKKQPDTHFVLKSHKNRRVVTIQEVVDALDADRGIDSLVEPGDWLREVFVARHWAPFSAIP